MSRRVSFMHTQEQMRVGAAAALASDDGYSSAGKDVTRRLNWKWAKPGMFLVAVSQTQGLRNGMVAETFGVIEILDVRREPLHFIGREADGARREGFPDMLAFEFVAMFREHMGADADAEVARITFRHVDALRIQAAWHDLSETQQHTIARGRR